MKWCEMSDLRSAERTGRLVIVDPRILLSIKGKFSLDQWLSSRTTNFTVVDEAAVADRVFAYFAGTHKLVHMGIA